MAASGAARYPHPLSEILPWPGQENFDLGQEKTNFIFAVYLFLLATMNSVPLLRLLVVEELAFCRNSVDSLMIVKPAAWMAACH